MLTQCLPLKRKDKTFPSKSLETRSPNSQKDFLTQIPAVIVSPLPSQQAPRKCRHYRLTKGNLFVFLPLVLFHHFLFPLCLSRGHRWKEEIVFWEEEKGEDTGNLYVQKEQPIWCFIGKNKDIIVSTASRGALNWKQFLLLKINIAQCVSTVL